MKAITVKQPWASLIVHGIKYIENRTWPTKYIGRVLIHSAARYDDRHREMSHLFTSEQFGSLSDDVRQKCLLSSFPKSSIIGSVEIVDCVINHESIWAEKTPEFTTKRANQEGFKPIYNWVLANPILFEKPIENVKGKLSFWEFNETEQ